VLRQQIRDFKAGRPVSTYVSPKALAEREHDLIVGSLKAIKALQARVKSAFSADMV
jgi:signal-transduction protein with cAMP-binding, CBS, and nucleotidyltransferase domain